jgi:hypothetical protein
MRHLGFVFMIFTALILISMPSAAATYQATPSTYASLIPTLQPGDTLILAAGSYSGMSIYNVNGTAASPITITGPCTGSPAVIIGSAGANTVRLQNASHVILRCVEINPRNLGGDGINGQTTTHHITIEQVLIYGCSDDQGTVGISTNSALTWNWIIRRVTITDCGTGMYLGYATAPFLQGLLEYNLVYDTVGYNVQIKEMNPLPSPGPAGMPTVTTTTIVRYNTFSKANNAASGGNARPNLVVGHAPLSGPAAPQENGYEIYGNFFYQNLDEALFQGAGNVALYDNLFVNHLAAGTSAVAFMFHNGGAPRIVRVFQNTVVARDGGISFSGSDTRFVQSAIGNAIFSGWSPLSGGTQVSNITGSYASAGTALNAPFAPPGSLDLFPQAGQLSGAMIDSSTYNTHTAFDKDFNGIVRPTATIRGAYGAQGTNPWWLPKVELQPQRPDSMDMMPPAAPTALRVMQP